ncbi:NAD-dependent epimerase/dehydratase family protein [Rhizobium sp. SGZ-381]|uniref:NAD-dependent epimerase/dehydratase family protein n=1 Tax=Rhizobium sp. SGZ-381 TaxID=3342800 RepID=UPI00366C889F
MYLITGATGFVGQALCRMLAERGLPFRPVSRLPRPGYATIGTITDRTDWRHALAGIDTVIHLAARVHVMRETDGDPLTKFRAMNVEATLHLARAATEAKVRRFIFASSIKVNGESTREGFPFHADDTPHPEDAYGLSKAEAERALLALGKESGMEVVIVRPPLVYGPGVGANFRLLMRLAAVGLPSPFAACDNRRSLVYVDNLCDLLLAAAQHPQAAGEVFLASDGEDLSTHQLFKRLAQLQGRAGLGLPIPPSLLKTLAKLAGKTQISNRLLKNLQVDIRKTGDLLDWVPPYPVAYGLQQTVARDKSPEAPPHHGKATP